MYVDAQDAAREREERIRESQAKAGAAKVEDMNARNIAGQGLFMDERRAYVNELVRVDLNTVQGHVTPHDLAVAQAEAWEALGPIIYEVPDRPLSVDAVKAIVAGLQRGQVSTERRGQLIDLITSTRSKVYQTRASKTQDLVNMNADVAKTRPALNALLKATGAGDSVPLARELLSESAAQATASQRARTAARPFGVKLPAPVSTRPAPPPGKLWPILPAGTPRR